LVAVDQDGILAPVIRSTDLANQVLGVVARRWLWIVIVVGLAAFASLPIGAILGWLSPVAGVHQTLAFTFGLWLTLAAAGVAVVALADQRPSRRATLATLGALSLVLLCGIPVSAFGLFAVERGPTGADCPECAVTTYLASAPFAGYGSDQLTFGRVLCDGRRDDLQRQADLMARDARAVSSSWQKVSSRDELVSVDGAKATVTARVSLDVEAGQHQSAGVTTWRYDLGSWTFAVVEDDGWRICAVDAPRLCSEVLNCDAPVPTPSVSPTEEDPLQHPREMLPCGPRDPFRERRNCPSASPDAPR
jgi:hypothetical protein